MTEAIHSSARSVLTRAIWRNIPRDDILQGESWFILNEKSINFGFTKDAKDY
jgi:hypothetical protein